VLALSGVLPEFVLAEQYLRVSSLLVNIGENNSIQGYKVFSWGINDKPILLVVTLGAFTCSRPKFFQNRDRVDRNFWKNFGHEITEHANAPISSNIHFQGITGEVSMTQTPRNVLHLQTANTSCIHTLWVASRPTTKSSQRAVRRPWIRFFVANLDCALKVSSLVK